MKNQNDLVHNIPVGVKRVVGCGDGLVLHGGDSVKQALTVSVMDVRGRGVFAMKFQIASDEPQA